MRSLSGCPVLVLLLLLGCLSASCARTAPNVSSVFVSPSADGSTSISGSVFDDSGALIPGVTVTLRAERLQPRSVVTDSNGWYAFFAVPAGTYTLAYQLSGFATTSKKVTIASGEQARSDAMLRSGVTESITVTAEAAPLPGLGYRSGGHRPVASSPRSIPQTAVPTAVSFSSVTEVASTEEYRGVEESGFQFTSSAPLSTFSVDVDRASYANIRRFVQQRQLPPRDAVRVEEMLNYFAWDYPDPGNDPFAIVTDVADCPWNPEHRLLQIGIQSRRMAMANVPPSNLVFLIDVSGSMAAPEKLPLVQRSFNLLIDQLRDFDRVAIVVYAGAAGLALDSTPGSEKALIRAAIDGLSADGSTAGAEGIQLAYEIARRNFIRGGNNRVILATDGDFNVGVSSDEELEQLITQLREDGVFLSILGVGTGNYKDAKMERLADKGNGNYAYVDTLREAQKALVEEMASTLVTVAKDVKVQVEFNPARVAAYRLIGYEDRRLEDRDFDDDTKDAGEVGAGHSVTVLYELVPAGKESDLPGYEAVPVLGNMAKGGDELLALRLRYKEPDQSTTQLLEKKVADRQASIYAASEDLRFAAAVAEVGMLLHESAYRGNSSFDDAIALAQSSRGSDRDGYRAEFIRIAESCKLLTSTP